MIYLTEYKNLKKLKIIVKDLREIQKQLILSIENLKTYKKYIPVAESVSALHTSKTMIEIHLNKYDKLLKEQEK